MKSMLTVLSIMTLVFALLTILSIGWWAWAKLDEWLFEMRCRRYDNMHGRSHDWRKRK